MRMTTICTAWRQAAISEPDKWAAMYRKELIDAMLECGVSTDEQIDAGIRWLRSEGKGWLPNPGAFAKACLSAKLDGMPTEEQAFRMAVDWKQMRDADKHPAVLAAIRKLDTWVWRQLPAQEARRQFAPVWAEIVEKVRANGMDWLPQIPKAISSPDSQAFDTYTVSKADGAKRIAEIRAKIFAVQNTGAEK